MKRLIPCAKTRVYSQGVSTGQTLRLALIWVGLCSLVGFSAPSCNTVEFYEKGALSRPAMEFGSDQGLSHFEQKVFYSIEGAAGGIGTSAGGGCGCY